MDATDSDILERYRFFCQVVGKNKSEYGKYYALLSQLEKLVEYSMLNLTTRDSPDKIQYITDGFSSELTKLRHLCAFPELSNKSIVAFGGGFSAGKSSLINSLVETKCLAVEIDPTTSMPAYLLKGDEESYHAINLHDQIVSLSRQQLVSLTHDEINRFGCQLSGLLKSAFVSIPHFKWQNIALLDTPGYSKAEVLSCEKKSDSSIAIAQLNSAKFITWLVSAEEGTVSEADLVCLSQLNPDIPKLIVISKADKKTPDDIEKILALVRSTLDNRGIRVLDVIPVSTRKKNNTMLSTMTAWINQWDKDQRESQLPYAFKRLFLIYQDYLEEKKRIAYYKLDQLNSLLVMSDNDDVADKASTLRDLINSELNQYKARVNDLDAFSHQFFSLLREIGECIDVSLTEPSSASMLNLTKLDLISTFDKAYSNDLDLKINAFDQVCEKQFTHSNDKLLKKIKNHACLYKSLEKVSKEACLKLTRSGYYFHHDWQCINAKVLSSADKLLRYQTYPSFYVLPANNDNDCLLRKTDLLKIF